MKGKYFAKDVGETEINIGVRQFVESWLGSDYDKGSPIIDEAIMDIDRILVDLDAELEEDELNFEARKIDFGKNPFPLIKEVL